MATEYAPLVVKGSDELPASIDGWLNQVMAGVLCDSDTDMYKPSTVCQSFTTATVKNRRLHWAACSLDEGYAQKPRATVVGSWKFTILTGRWKQLDSGSDVTSEGKSFSDRLTLNALLIPPIYRHHCPSSTISREQGACMRWPLSSQVKFILRGVHGGRVARQTLPGLLIAPSGLRALRLRRTRLITHHHRLSKH